MESYERGNEHTLYANFLTLEGKEASTVVDPKITIRHIDSGNNLDYCKENGYDGFEYTEKCMLSFGHCQYRCFKETPDESGIGINYRYSGALG